MSRFLCIVGGSRAARQAAARERIGRGPATEATAAARWPFERHVLPADPPASPLTIAIPELHDAFPAGQTTGTRLVLTQSTYQLQRWLDWLDAHPQAQVVAHASRTALSIAAPEARAGRGPWARIEVVDVPGDAPHEASEVPEDVRELHHAFGSAPPGKRLDICRRAVADAEDRPALHLALASVLMEHQDLPAAQAAIDRALALAPDWEAPWFEYGKLWLRGDDLELAAERFAEAARLMPSFSAALGNLGAALAEIDRPEEAVAALTQALRYDPAGHPILNNLAVVYREQGRLDAAVETGRRVVALAPDFVFGRYNLGHALFLQGHFEEARAVYEEAYRRDPQRNPVQACRLAVVRAACDDSGGAVSALEELAAAVPEGVLAPMLEEAGDTLALLLNGPCAGSTAVAQALETVTRLKEHGAP